DRGRGRVGCVTSEPFCDPPGTVRIVERELAEHPGAENRDVLAVLACGGGNRIEIQQAADVDALEARGRRHEQARAVRRGEDQCLRTGLARDLAWRIAEVEARNRLEPAFAGELRRALGLRE